MLKFCLEERNLVETSILSNLGSEHNSLSAPIFEEITLETPNMALIPFVRVPLALIPLVVVCTSYDTTYCVQNESPIAYLSRSTPHRTIDLRGSANYAYVHKKK